MKMKDSVLNYDIEPLIEPAEDRVVKRKPPGKPAAKSKEFDTDGLYPKRSAPPGAPRSLQDIPQAFQKPLRPPERPKVS